MTERNGHFTPILADQLSQLRARITERGGDAYGRIFDTMIETGARFSEVSAMRFNEHPGEGEGGTDAR